MEENLSWQAKLAKANINILGVDKDRWYYEFMYHPRPGQTKWSKTFHEMPQGEVKWLDDEHPERWYREQVDNSPEAIAKQIQAEVLALRKELEG